MNLNYPEARSHTTNKQLTSWKAFQEYVATLEDPARKAWDEVWFRGQSDAEWPLSTSLERRSKETLAVANYFNLISEIQPAIETFTGGQFSTPDGLEVGGTCHDSEVLGLEQLLRSHATYLAHLRHGGFPSPLLDWTGSPYVAAYFAFHHAVEEGDVAIYAYRERTDNFKITGINEPRIVSFGPLIKTHKRHFRQQSRYTACVKFENGRWSFAAHDSVFGQKNYLKQDLLWKITIPASERLKVLRFCDQVNLNEFTLFDTEEGLLEMQAMRVFDLRT
jgi:hypothetical protein